MRIDCFFTHQSCGEQHFFGRAALVIDVLRATSTIITALDNGAAAVLPIADIGQALREKRQRPDAILAGEREGERLQGFDLGNSPLEFSREAVAGRLIIACTTNGTAAMVKAGAADKLWLAALLNARAVADKLLAEQVRELTILCSGTDGQPSLDDILAAGAVLHQLQRGQTLEQRELNDAARIALRLYQDHSGLDMRQALLGASHGQKLLRCGRGADVAYCARENISATVPRLDKSSGCVYA